MKYVIEKNGALVSSISTWTPGLAKKCGLVGNKKAPGTLPFDLGEGAKLRAVRTVRVNPNPYQYLVDDGGILVGDEWVITQSLQDKTVEQIATQKRGVINPMVRSKIIAIATEDQQRNMIAALAELNHIKDGSYIQDDMNYAPAREWTTEEKQQVLDIKNIWKEIADLRSRSNQLMGMTDADLAVIDLDDDQAWELSPGA